MPLAGAPLAVWQSDKAYWLHPLISSGRVTIAVLFVQHWSIRDIHLIFVCTPSSIIIDMLSSYCTNQLQVTIHVVTSQSNL
jgi:hypothetical protein